MDPQTSSALSRDLTILHQQNRDNQSGLADLLNQEYSPSDWQICSMPGFFGNRLLLDLKFGGIKLLFRKSTVDPHLLEKANIQTSHDLQIS